MATNSRAKSREAASVSEHVSTLTNDVRKVGGAVKQMAADRADEMRDIANDYLEQGQERIRAAGDDLVTRVQERPMKSLLIAAGIGFLLGIFWVRR